ncbi:hypothetical protein COY93_04505 [Candidatus Uhrbacteria bacterium CG_4_10_14_0_8_um_filter_58_22]|uniref:Uncharacterized protein n=1 Tax=Candidatus Uhrbacteria bacterium CG_4_10_14_0_8_um_filter_58_22 TaxID=1975029 RepID=A0A2M7QAA8_9BACT|nr:MAG: hypothetical protein AUJ19_02365 [Parcubacteria group bacterium CG1_02_58_44]PIY61976.1 MAG: hypothetical protein COY93_04505 [Candidatus Uhrbacteria bacterium CG_4_10_14_0_8_um_filter_58_22]
MNEGGKTARLVIELAVAVAITVGMAVLIGLSVRQYQKLAQVAVTVDGLNLDDVKVMDSEISDVQTSGETATEFMVHCFSGSDLPTRFAEVERLIVAEGWAPLTGENSEVCTRFRDDKNFIVKTNNFPSPLSDQRFSGQFESILLVDISKGDVREVVREEWNELYGRSALGNIVGWSPLSVSYEKWEFTGEGIDLCSDSMAGAPVYSVESTDLVGGFIETEKTCRQVDCDSDVFSCSRE